MKKGLIAFLSVFMIAVLAACGSTEGEEIELSETSVKLNQNETMQIEATVLPDEEDVDQSVTWESSDEDVVAVNQSGEIGGMGGGTATVTVTSDVYEDVSAELDVTVLPMVDYVAVEEPNLSLTLNKDGSSVTHTIEWEVAPVNDQENTYTLDDVTFTSNNEDVVTVDGDTLTAHSAGSTQVRMDAGDEFVFFDVSVSDYQAEHTIADVRAADTGTEVETYGVINSITNHATFSIEDAGSAISVYDGGQDFIEDLEVGDEIYITGERDEYNGLMQIAPDDIIVRNEGMDLKDPVDLSTADLEDEDALLGSQGKRVTMEQLEITEFETDQYENRNLVLESLVNGTEISLRYDSRLGDTDAEDQIDEFEVGDEVALVGITLGWFYGPQVLYSDASQIVAREDFDDAQVQAAMDKDLDVSGEYTEDITLADEYEQDDYDLDVSWDSSDTDYVADDGTVTRPDALEEMVEVELTATITNPDDTDFEHEVVSTVTILPYTPEEAALQAVADEMPETVAYGDDLSEAMYPDGGFDFTQYIDEESELFYEDGEWDLNVEWSSECAFLDPDDGTLTDVGYYDRMAEVTVMLTNDAAVNRFEAEHTFTVTLEGDEFADDAALESYLTNDLTKEEIGLPTGDIYEDVELPSTLEIGGYELDITWASDTTGVMTDDGEVTRSDAGDGDDSVTMTATFDDGSDVDQDVDMVFNVKDLMSDSEIDTAIEDEFGTAPTATATEDFDLEDPEEFISELAVEAGRTLNVEWSVTDDQDYLTADGEVTRPEYGEDDEVVTLTMTVTDDDSYSYDLDAEITVSAITVSPQEQALYDDLENAIDEGYAIEDLEFDDADNDDISLPASVSIEGFDLTMAWELEENEFVELDGNDLKVHRVPSIYEDDMTLELTGTFTQGDFEHTKTLELDLHAKRVEDVAAMDDLYLLEENYFDWTLEVEETFTLIDWYNLDNHVFDVDWDVELTDDEEERDLEDFVDLEAGTITKPAMNEDPLEITLTATLDGEEYEEDITVNPVNSTDQLHNRLDNYIGSLLPEETYTNVELPTEMEILGNSLDLEWTVVTGSAYITDEGVVTPHDDEEVSVILGVEVDVNNGDSSFTSEYEFIIAPPASEEEVKAGLDDKSWGFPTEVTSNLDLPSSYDYAGYELDISWSSDNTSYLADDGTVTRPAIGEADEEVTLTATYTDDDDFSHTVDFEMVVLAEVASDLFISEYIEGSGSNKAIEIYNGTGSEVDLSNYSFKLYSNGSTDSSQGYTLSGTLADGETYVSVNPSADSALLDIADYTGGYPNIVANYNGNDAIEFLKDGTVIDTFGVVGESDYWDVGSGSAEDNTLVRSSDVYGPSATWDPTEWEVYPQDTFDYLGSHTME